MADAEGKVGYNRWVKLDPTVNLGHVMTAVVMLTTVIAGWTSLRGDQERALERIIQLERREELQRERTMAEIRTIAALTVEVTSLKIAIDNLGRQVTALYTNRGGANERN